MNTIKEIRFITTNYYNLQGLRLVPLGLLLVYVCIWANGASYPIEPSYFTSLILVMVITLLAALGVDRFYKRFFGVVKQTPESRNLEAMLWFVGGILATAAFWLDVSFSLPLSLVGLVAGLGLIADYLRITWLVKGRFLLYYPIGAVIIMIISLLPVFGLPGWWHVFGLRAQMFAIAFSLGIFTLIAGICSHLSLIKSLRTQGRNQ